MAWLYKRGARWWIGWRENGKQQLKPTGEKDQARAKEHLKQYEALQAVKAAGKLTDEIVASITGKRSEKITVGNFLNRWLRESEAQTKAVTMVKYRQVMRELKKEIGESTLLEDVTANRLKEFFAERQVKYASGTVKGWRRIINSAFLQAQEEGLVRGNPVALSKRGTGRGRKSDTKVKRPFTVAEVQSLHAKATPFWRYMIQMGFFTGQSLGDLVTLRRQNVDLAQGQISLNRRKTGTRVNIPLAKPLRSLLQSVWPKNAQDYFWPVEAERYEKTGSSSFSQEFYDLLHSVGLVPARGPKAKAKGTGRDGKRETASLGFHNLRHTFVTMLKQSGAMDSVARELAGHGSNTMSAVYTHLPAETLSKAIDSLPALLPEVAK